jgi:hypothetical protein
MQQNGEPGIESLGETPRNRAHDGESFVLKVGNKELRGSGAATVGVIMTFAMLGGMASLYHEIDKTLSNVLVAVDRAAWMCLLTPEQRLKIQADMPPSIREMILRGEFPRQFPDNRR